MEWVHWRGCNARVPLPSHHRVAGEVAMSRLVRRLLAPAFASPSPARPSRRAAALRTRLLVQGLEGRVVPASFTVLNTSDAGAGSLRQAILSSNAANDADTIVFNT